MSRPPGKSARTKTGKPLPNRLRIIGGRWRSVPITFPAIEAVRPSPDRVRETLFNWLQPVIVGSRCLDLFAGSGALGLEALSRGASSVDFVDSEPAIGRHIAATLEKLCATGGTAHVSDALRFLDRSPQPFDIVFLDPPYASDLLAAVCNKLAAGWLAPDAYIYLECPADRGLPALPANWSVHRTKQAGQVGYHLLRAHSAEKGDS
ncbi:MAG TPA: 16S rRNA (guanine(966)-N(2))-methyltransferase RsmD [Povalibacter sp.]|uniref:16S rRNA (guanine(966)-N(2))-methyltransferase RsmD n=1 Tax=Povalibacter sp. TaxID=1962978 RepID=UPI002BD608A7|nr:16S rRNA (guanine(966)-N(2))-methyltransferase RsmD [Povalibacter sp.]HMN44284.1 16S rRNA (guanine(966)-N(2))-methyltransferase RsmD [Povalibacter sp.]